MLIRSLVTSAALVLSATFAVAAPPDDEGPRHLRVKDGDVVSLEIASRTFEPAFGDGPTVSLVGVVHVGDRAYYEALERHLREHEIVLYESVKPFGAGGAGGETDAERIASTEAGLEFVARLIERHRAVEGEYPAGFIGLRRFVRGEQRRLADFLDDAWSDGWGRRFEYERTGGDDEGYALLSLGADGAPGGEGADADIPGPAPGTVPALSKDGDHGIQAELAKALGLEFQLDSIDYDHAGWRCSDMALDQVARALEARGSDLGIVQPMLEGGGLTDRIARTMLGLLRTIDSFANGTLSATLKILMIEMLGDEQMIDASMAGLGPGFVDVIIGERNGVALDDLRAVREQEPGVESVAIFYGAGHLPDLEQRLVEDFDYRFVETRWLTAIEVDLAASGIDPRRVSGMRRMMRTMMRQANQAGFGAQRDSGE